MEEIYNIAVQKRKEHELLVFCVGLVESIYRSTMVKDLRNLLQIFFDCRFTKYYCLVVV